MAPNRVITKRLYVNKNSGNQNVSFDWANVYTGYPYGYVWVPPRMRVDLISPSVTPVLYQAQAYGGSSSSASFINPVDVVYQQVAGVNQVYPSVPTNWANSWNNGYYNNLYGVGAAWNNDFTMNNAL
jgi:hypothetical protein